MEAAMDPLRFRRYASIDNHTYEKSLELVRSLGFDRDREWVVSEKLHGANFCFVTDGSRVAALKRRSKLTGEDSFFEGWERLLARLTPAAKEAHRLFQELRAASKGSGGAEGASSDCIIETIWIYGEFFGGAYPGLEDKKTAGEICIQKGIWYSPKQHFYAFDIHDGRRYADHKEAFETLTKAGFMTAQPLFQGSFEDAMKFPELFVTTIPSLLGLPPLKDNLAEGIVIKPVETCYFPTGSRVIFKKKISRYSEHVPRVRPVKVPEEVGVDTRQCITDFGGFINRARLDSVLSKIGAVHHNANLGKIAGLLARDALEDYRKHPELIARFHALEKADQKRISKFASEGAKREVAKWATEQRKRET